MGVALFHKTVPVIGSALATSFLALNILILRMNHGGGGTQITATFHWMRRTMAAIAVWRRSGAGTCYCLAETECDDGDGATLKASDPDIAAVGLPSLYFPGPPCPVTQGEN